MTIEQAIADQTAAIKEGNDLLRQVLEAIKSGGAVKAADVKSSTAGKDPAGSSNDGAQETIYWHIPGTEEFGTVESDAEFKKLKKSKAKAIKIPESKYNTLVEAASKVDDAGEYSERILAIIDGLPDDLGAPDSDKDHEGNLAYVGFFQKYLSKDLDKNERDARAEIIKPILEGVKVPKATAVKADDRRDVLIEVIKGIELHLEETGQVSDDEDGLV